MVWFLIIGIVLVLLGFVICSVEDYIPLPVISTIFGMILIFGYIEVSDKSPRPIDVYRGNTTLKISYIDSVATDSMVVWKNKNK